MVWFGAVCLIPFLYGTLYLVHNIRKRRLAAAFGMLLLLLALGMTVVLLIRLSAHS